MTNNRFNFEEPKFIKVLWFSRHTMTEDQMKALGTAIQVEQVNKSINSAYEL